jgi:predicted Zn-dependent protease
MDKAAQVADKAVAALPQNAEALSMRGSIELYRSQTDEAYRDFSAAAQLAPHSPDPRFFMALVDYRQSKFDQAAKVLRDAIASGIADSDLHYILAECVLRIDPSNASAALSELDRAIQLNPKSVPARILRGQTLLAARRPQDAVVDLKIARTSTPTLNGIQAIRLICWDGPISPLANAIRRTRFSRSWVINSPPTKPIRSTNSVTRRFKRRCIPEPKRSAGG